jgi:alkylation response protein AidB-like acyl-CoA dehydrogenase
MFTFSPIKQRLDLLVDYVRETVRDGQPMRDDPVVRRQIAQLATDAEVARVLGLRVVAASMKGEKVPGTSPPTVESSQYKLFATEFSRRLASTSMDIAAPGSALRVRVSPTGPMEGRAESTYRYTVIDTIGGGASEIQKNIIARRGLGLPKNF